ncbi:MAG: hypothetical protein HQK53_01215, partial [Oligoflexia bacterium]|nr:hypothetical protein [Oligoflexia bacterium]
FSSGAREYYYNLGSSDSDANRAVCQKSPLIDQLISPTPQNSSLTTGVAGYQFVYQISDVCSNNSCQADVQSMPVMLYTTNGKELRNIKTSHLALGIKAIKESVPRGGVSCTLSKECVSQGFDCCLDGQCVRDKAVRSGVDTASSEYLQSQKDIASNPANVFNYQRFYYICTQNPNRTPNPTPETTPVINYLSFEEMEELYRCTVPFDSSEMSICTIKYENISTPRAEFTAKPGPFITGGDDRNFRDTYMGSAKSNLPAHSIYQLLYGGVLLYTVGSPEPSTSVAVIDSTSVNDNLVDSQKVLINTGLPAGAVNDDLKIRYKIDGSCEPLGDGFAKCYRYYKQGQDIGSINDPLLSDKDYLLPYYANTSRQMTVEVNGNLAQQGYHWGLSVEGLPAVVFTPYNESTHEGMNIGDGQEVKITYYADTSAYSVLSQKQLALDKIAKYCKCGTAACYLKPEYKDEGSTLSIINYICDYVPAYIGDIPAQATANVDLKSAPIRFYDSSGSSHDFIDPKTPVPNQEGNVFKYVGGITKTNRPNNVFDDTGAVNPHYVGFNEVYGYFNPTDINATMPPKTVRVKNSRTYNIFINNTSKGKFNNCQSCGIDYYSSLDKIFPENFSNVAGGYIPDPRRNERRPSVSNTKEGNYRSDDLLFGRACFVPATMIPWTHRKRGSVADQRKHRLEAQHFLFANGYNRDWYGFDYGSLIGSFDGVTWFSIGSQRRVLATSNFLYLAFNAYFADLTTKSSLEVMIVEDKGTADSSTLINSDFESDGAQCQKYHVCDNDVDCITKLGWDYTCLNVGDIYTNWPQFDANAKELWNAEKRYKLTSLLVGGFEGSVKRCVYRGRGAPCVKKHLSVTNPALTYSGGGASPGLWGCMTNYHCEDFLDENGSLQAKFNRKIARFAVAPSKQNVGDGDDPDYFGLGARILGRPYSYNGQEAITSDLYSQLGYNQIRSICIPGRNVGDGSAGFDYEQQNYAEPGAMYLGDRVSNIGMSKMSEGPAVGYGLSACGIVDKKGNYLHLNADYKRTPVSSAEIKAYAGTQAFSTNILSAFQKQNPSYGLLTESTEVLTVPLFQKNRCLRAPASPCFTDFDCGPSTFIAPIVSGMEWQTEMQAAVNEAEFNFWSEELVCGEDTSDGSGNYDFSLNRCCRPAGGNVHVGVDMLAGKVELPGVDIPISTRSRASWVAPAYYSTKFIDPLWKVILPSLKEPTPDACGGGDQLNSNFVANAGCLQLPAIGTPAQFMTLHKVLGSICCGGHWIRQFHEDNSGGGHDWGSGPVIKARKQEFDFSSFRCLGWFPLSTTKDASEAWKCFNPKSSACNAYNLSGAEEVSLNNFFGSLEQLGIPQLAIKSTNARNRLISETDSPACRVDPDNENIDARPTANIGPTEYTDIPVPGTVLDIHPTVAAVPSAAFEYYSVVNGTAIPYFAADDLKNFDTTSSNPLKLIFSKDKFSCCLPSGVDYPAKFPSGKTLTNDMCCTGQAMEYTNVSKNQKMMRCCLGDYADISVYFSRYVSSEAAHLDDSLFDPLTGILGTGMVMQLATRKSICCLDVQAGASGNSRYYSTGDAVDYLAVPGQNVPGGKMNCKDNDGSVDCKLRFGYESTDDNVNIFEDAKARWNTHIYCVPPDS